MGSYFTLAKSLFFWNDLEKEILKDNGDSPLITKHSSFQNIHIKSTGKSVKVRVVSIPHYKSKKLPPLPKVIFIHGLGGQLSQFEYLIDYFAYFSTVLAIDLPGHGRSEVDLDWNTYTPEALADVIQEVIESQEEIISEETTNNEGELLAVTEEPSNLKPASTSSSASNTPGGTPEVRPHPYGEEENDNDINFDSIDNDKTVKPDEQFILIGHSMGTSLAGRLAIRYGPTRCKGVVAICPPSHVDPKLESSKNSLPYLPQFVFNIFRAIDRTGGLTSPSVNRMISPSIPPTDELRIKQLRWNMQVNTGPWMRTAYNFKPLTSEEWGKVECPVLLIGGEDDQVTPKQNIYDIYDWMNPHAKGKEGNMIKPILLHDTGHAALIEKYHILEGVISDFIINHINVKLSLGWQLAYLASKSDKWSLKNEAKWRKTLSVGEQIKGTQLRGMKTLRQNDPDHSPYILEDKYPDICSIIDISREPPPYDPETFKRIVYHKFPTVSKLPPTKKEVADFIQMVDLCIEEIKEKAHSSTIAPTNPTIAVHCHYGFNRTGFFLCSYMVERHGYSIKDAVELFADSRPPGIKHPHFIDELYVRYEL